MKTKLLLLIFLLGIGYSAQCQPRVSSIDKYKVISKSQILSLPIGWFYDSFSDRWCGYYGLTCGEYKNNHKTPRHMTADELSGAGEQGIYSMHVQKVQSGEKNFYLLYHIYYTGDWDYPAIERGWRYWKDCNIYVFSEDEYTKLINPQIGLNKIKVFDIARIYKYGTAQANIDIKTQLNKIFRETLSNSEERTGFDKDNIFYLKLEDDGKTVRFHIPTNKKLWSEAQIENEKIRKEKGDLAYYYEIKEYHCLDFEHEYYELTPSQFALLKVK